MKTELVVNIGLAHISRWRINPNLEFAVAATSVKSTARHVTLMLLHERLPAAAAARPPGRCANPPGGGLRPPGAVGIASAGLFGDVVPPPAQSGLNFSIQIPVSVLNSSLPARSVLIM